MVKVSLPKKDFVKESPEEENQVVIDLRSGLQILSRIVLIYTRNLKSVSSFRLSFHRQMSHDTSLLYTVFTGRHLSDSKGSSSVVTRDDRLS